MQRSTARVTISYVFDWILVLILAAGGGVLNYISGYHRPFTLTEYDIAYPYVPNIISVPVLVAIALFAPAIIILVLCIALTPQPSASTSPRQTRWRRSMWDVHVGWLGLALSLAATLFITSGLKDMVGKPRPDLLGRCNPDTTQIAKYLVGGFGNSLNSEAEPLVSDGICQQTDRRVLDDGFAAFPSGHSSFSVAGLVYLSLWLSTRLRVVIPYLDRSRVALQANPADAIRYTTQTRNAQSGPPLWAAGIAWSPFVVALYVCASRYADFHHAGIDIFAGAVLGAVMAWVSFRLYHLPIRQGYGVPTWAPRSPRNAFFLGAEDSVGFKDGQHRAGPAWEEGRDEGTIAPGPTYRLADLERQQPDPETHRRSETSKSSDGIVRDPVAYRTDYV